MASGTIVVEGLASLQRALSFSERAIRKDLRDALKDAAEPVRADAEALALAGIPRVGIPWSRMRVGVTRTMVYVVPRERGVKSRGNARFRRPKFGDLLLDRALIPGLAQNESQIEQRVIDMLNGWADRWAKVG